MSNFERLRNDAAECTRLSQLTSSENVRCLLQKEAERLNELLKTEVQKAPVKVAKNLNCITTKIVNYGWDQSDKFVKLYITLSEAQTLPNENVISSFQKKGIELNVNGLKDRNHILVIKNLLNAIVPEESYHKVKTDMVVVFLKKSKSQHWACVTESEQKAKEVKAPKMEDSEDPNQGLMNLMKKMYDDGDDEMKRSIAKAWTEAREKKSDL